MTGPARALNTTWFVQRNVDKLAVLPEFIEQTELKAISFKYGALIIDNLAIDADFARPYQLPTRVARTEALRLQDAIKAELCHPKNVLIL